MSFLSYIKDPTSITLNYYLPEHLSGIKEINDLRSADLNEFDKELRAGESSLEEKISKGVIWRKGFPGMILDVTSIHHCQRNGHITLNVSPIHPHRADLAYKIDRTLKRNVSPLTATSILIDNEGNFVLGIRGGSVESGKIGIIPGGHTDYKIPKIINPFDTFKDEFQEELGYNYEKEIELPILGVFTNKDTNGINVLYSATTSLFFNEINDRWKNAKDRGEHNFLFTVSEEDISKLAETGKLKFNKREYITTVFFQDCFKIYLQRIPLN